MLHGILFALAAILFTVKKKNNVDESAKIFTSALIFGNAATLFVAGAMYYLYWDVRLVIATLITLTVLYFAYNIYGGNFFSYSLITAAGYLTLQISKCESHIIYYLGLIGIAAAKILVFAIPIAAIVLGIMLISNNKNYTIAGVTIGGKKCAVTFFVAAAAILLGAMLQFVSLAPIGAASFILLGSYLVIAVICTVKMI